MTLSPPAAPPVLYDAPGVSRARALSRLLRPRHWVKNAFVPAPAVFAGVFVHLPEAGRALAAAGMFCLASSAVYVFNDLLDAPTDRLHPVKRHTRPLASGALSPRSGRVALALLLGGLAVALLLFPAPGLAIGAYLLINLAYTLRLKHVAVVDLFCIACGFMLRVYAGAQAVQVPLSSWMLITTLALALYLAAVKRRQELASSGPEARRVLGAYTLPLLDGYAQTAASASVVFYSLYVIDVRPRLAVTVPFVLLGIFRYSYLVQTRQVGESPTDALWTDLPLILTILGWAALCVYAFLPGT
jgi:4-hydroxybenzoate polyprenyltransferase